MAFFDWDDETQLSSSENRLLTAFGKLNANGKELVIQNAEGLAGNPAMTKDTDGEKMA